MKKITLIALAISALTVQQSFGQGQIVFANSATAGSKIYTNTAASTSQGGTLISGAGSYTFALFAYYTGSASTSTNSSTTPAASLSTTPWNNGSWELVGYATNSATVGRIIAEDGGAGYLAVPNLGSGYYASMEIIGWNTAVGGSTVTSFNTAFNQALALSTGTASSLLFGYSNVGSLLLGNGTLPLNSNVLGGAAGNIGGFTLGTVIGTAPVPEPSTMALAALGGASLLLFRRRK